MNGIKEPQTNQNCAPAASQSTGVKIESIKVEIPQCTSRGKKAVNRAGHKYGMLTVIRRAYKPGKNAYWLCECECGKEVEVSACNLRSGNSKSCGCSTNRFISEKNTKHGLTNHPIYSVWEHIRSRCNYEKNNRYHRYGGRGISICKEWEDSETFVKWALESGWKPGLQIDRIDNDGDYCPENCRFVTPGENTYNKTIPYSNNRTGYSGVHYRRHMNRYQARITFKWKTIAIGHFDSIEEAAIARDQYIIDNNLPHALQILTRD
jgi:hypothetical protein